MGIDPHLYVVLTPYTDEAMVSAKSLLDLANLADSDVQIANLADSDVQTSSLASAALIAAIAHLERVTTISLVSDLATKQAEAGREPEAWEVDRQLESNFRGRLRQLAATKFGPDVEFDTRRPGARFLMQAIERRNHLVHDRGTYTSGKLVDLAVELEDGEVAIPISEPLQLWREMTIEYAREVIETVEAFVDGVGFARDEDAPLDERFFSRSGDQRASRSNRDRFGLES